MASRQIAAVAYGDVTGDRRVDTVRITGVKLGDGDIWEQLQLEVQNGRTGQATVLPLPAEVGYGPQLVLSPLTGTSRLDILALIQSGGSGAIIYFAVYAYQNGGFQLLLDNDAYDRTYTYRVIYENGYLVRIESNANDIGYLITVAGKGQTYLDGIYCPDGILKKPTEGFVSPASVVSPVHFSGQPQTELMLWQLVSGQYRADGLGYVINVLRWNGTGFDLYAQTLGVETVSE